MGQAKKAYMEIEEAEHIVISIIDIIHSERFEGYFEQAQFNSELYVNFLHSILNQSRNEEVRFDSRIRNFVFEYLSEIPNIFYLIYEDEDIKDKQTIIQGIKKIKYRLDKALVKSFELFEYFENRQNVVNSESFYNEKILQLSQREKELLNALEETQGKSNVEIKRAKLEVEATKNQILNLQKELEFKQKQEEAKEDWNNKITITFTDLKTYLNPIKDEHERLCFLYKVYMYMSAFLVVVVIFTVVLSLVKLCSIEGYPPKMDYFKMYIPLPIAGALLWGFIYQMNRAQRQLVAIAKSIHKVEYVQGLLLSINKLAPTVEDGIMRINAALDKLINNHLSEKGIDTEEDLIKEEKKDVNQLEGLIKILKEVKGIVGKE